MFKHFSFLLILILCLSSLSLTLADSIPLIETPVPAPVHDMPESTPEPPSLIDLTRNRNAMEGFRFPVDAEFLHIWFPIIANADEAVITYGDEVWLIDCADNREMGRRGVHLLEELGVSRIDRLFNTHPHHDHLGGLQLTNEAAPVQELLICFPEDVNEHMVGALEYAREQSIPVAAYGSGDVFTMGGGKVSLKFFLPQDDTLDMNNSSAVTLLQYGSCRILFMADVDFQGQKVLLDQVDHEDLRAEIVKYPHHGKKGLLEEFYEVLQPSLAVVTNIWVDWGGIEFMQWKRVPYLFTCADDTYVHLYTDGRTWVVERVHMDTIGK